MTDRTVAWAGTKAVTVLERGSSGVVAGVSSQGVFLQPADDLTLFLSREGFRGPLTLNLDQDPISLGEIKAGDPFILSLKKISFPDTGGVIPLQGAKTWQPAAPSEPTSPERIPSGNLLQQLRRLSGSQPFYPLLESLGSGQPASIPGFPMLEERVNSLIQDIQGGRSQLILAALVDLIGLGPGLTPWGDDFLIGFLLIFNRLKYRPRPDLIPFPLEERILEAARSNTTYLSSSLLECAAEGLADERLISILDSLAAGVEIADQDLANLLSWGSTSGEGVLGGMFAGSMFSRRLRP